MEKKITTALDPARPSSLDPILNRSRSGRTQPRRQTTVRDAPNIITIVQ
jgi:hypothetical protein